MKKYIEQLKQKPEPVRNQIALVGAIIGSAIIALFWITTLSFTSSPADATSLKNTNQPFAAIKDNAAHAFTDLKASINH